MTPMLGVQQDREPDCGFPQPVEKPQQANFLQVIFIKSPR
jgi:hypothetical protein